MAQSDTIFLLKQCDVRAGALVLMEVGRRDRALELALEVFARDTYGDRLPVVVRQQLYASIAF